MDAKEALKVYFGYDSYKPGQEEIIDSILAGKDVLAIMPTGSGKSICYQVPALLSPGITIVISPLISLMQDQVKALNEAGIKAGYINSSLTESQISTVYARALDGAYKILYVAPERLESYEFTNFVDKVGISMVTVDEAHCISQWGQDFRPSYLKIVNLIDGLSKRPIVSAFTATATEEVKNDISCVLKLKDPKIVVTGFDRENLYFDVETIKKKDDYVLEYIKNHPEDSGIIYCATRKNVDALYELLSNAGIQVARYHAGMNNEDRKESQNDFIYDRSPVIIATNAFGMGIDKSNVRFVIHYNMPQSMENYYQEAGRAGRDSQRAYALLLVASDDSDRIARRFEQEFPPLEKIKEIYERLCSYLQIGIGDGGEASFLFNIHDFCARERLYSGTVTSALKLLQQNGYMTLTDAQENPARVMFCVSRDELYKLRVQRDELDHFIRTLLRLYNGVFTEFRPIDEGELATWSGYTVQRVKELLKRLWQLRVIRYIPSNRSPILFMNEERLPRADLYIAPETYKRRQELMRERFEQMIAYAANEQECRSAVLERYFGEENPAPCGVCDICLARKRAAKAAAREAGTAPGTVHPGAAGDAPGSESALRENLLARLARSPADPHRLAAELACPPERLAEAVRELLGEGAVRSFADGRIALFSGPDGPDKAK